MIATKWHPMLNDRVKVKTVIEIFRVWLYHLLLKAFFFLKFSSFANNFEKTSNLADSFNLRTIF